MPVLFPHGSPVAGAKRGASPSSLSRSQSPNRGVQAMISSQSRVQYREGYEPSDNYADEVRFSPDLDPTEPSFEAHPRGTSGNKRSLGRELLRLAIQTLRTLKTAVSGLSPGLGIKPPEGAPKSLHQVTPQETALVKDAGVMQSTPAQVTAEFPHQVRQQLETIASDLATVRSLVEQLTASQKQMALDIASMETGKDNFSQRTWWLSRIGSFSLSDKQEPTKDCALACHNRSPLRRRTLASAYTVPSSALGCRRESGWN